jgi:hypothetical protein
MACWLPVEIVERITADRFRSSVWLHGECVSVPVSLTAVPPRIASPSGDSHVMVLAVEPVTLSQPARIHENGSEAMSFAEATAGLARCWQRWRTRR